MPRVTLVLGDLTLEEVDAIVNAASPVEEAARS